MKKVLLFCVISLLVLAVPLFGQGSKESSEEVVAFGESVEDQLVIATSTGPDVDWAEAAIPEFKAYIKEKYNKDVEVILDPGAMAVRWTKFTTEWPNPSADVHVVYPNLLYEGIEKGYWAKIDDYLSDSERSGLNKNAYDKYKGYGIPYDRIYYGPVVRKDMIPFQFTSWNDLSDSRLTNRMTFDSALKVGSGYLAVQAAAIAIGANWEDWRNDDGTLDKEAIKPTLKKVREWYENSLTLTEGSGTIRPLLSRGESLVSLWWSNQAIVESGKGVNVAFTFPKEGTISWGDTNWVVADKAKNRNLGIEWVKFITSAKGYEIAYNKAKLVGYLIPRSDVTPPAEEQDFLPSDDVIVHSGNDFRLFIESEIVQPDFMDVYTKFVIEGRE
jgi:spermidine/putrescine-binding protein